jgi:hypothetical protein
LIFFSFFFKNEKKSDLKQQQQQRKLWRELIEEKKHWARAKTGSLTPRALIGA